MEEDGLHVGGELRLVRELRGHLELGLNWELLLHVQLFGSEKWLNLSLGERKRGLGLFVHSPKGWLGEGQRVDKGRGRVKGLNGRGRYRRERHRRGALGGWFSRRG